MKKSDSQKIITITERLFEIHPALLPVESVENWLRVANHQASTAHSETKDTIALNLLRITLMISERHLTGVELINGLLDDCFSGRDLDLSAIDEQESRRSA